MYISIKKRSDNKKTLHKSIKNVAVFKFLTTKQLFFLMKLHATFLKHKKIKNSTKY